MITTLARVKARLGIADTTSDAVLTEMIEACGGLFDKETGRTLARTESATEEFDAEALGVVLRCYPVEVVTTFELKENEADGWVPTSLQPHLVRRGCVLVFQMPLGISGQLGRVTYTGGYVMPGAEAGEGQRALPAALELAAVEQVAFWYQNKGSTGMWRIEGEGGQYTEASNHELWVPWARDVVRKFRIMEA